MYKYHFVAIGMFAAWANLTLMCRTLPQTGNYIEMLVKVAGSFAQFLGTFSSLLVGFGVSLAVLIPTTPIFKEPIGDVLGKVRLITRTCWASIHQIIVSTDNGNDGG